MNNYILLTKDNVHEATITSLESKEGYLSDGRSYVSETWTSGQTAMVTYYFSAKGFKVSDKVTKGNIIECAESTNEIMLDYLISEHKLTKDDPRNYIETVMYYVEGEVIFSVTVAERNSLDEVVYRECEL